MEERALAFAEAAHAGQFRSYTGEPYIEHPKAVAALVRSVPHSQAMIAAALLHDVVEDTHITLDYIVRAFGFEVGLLVWHLTDATKPADGNRAARKAIYREQMARASTKAKTIKLADLIDNLRSIVAHDPKFAKVYIEEMRLLLEVLTEGDSVLYAMARQIVDDT